MSKRSGILLALSFVMALVAGCGNKSTPVAPVDTVAPVAVLDLDAVVVMNPRPSVTLTWAANTEPDLAGYRVYRAVNSGTTELVGVETSTTFRDGTVVNGNVYTYAIGAFDRSGNESPRMSKVVSLIDGGGHAQLD